MNLEKLHSPIFEKKTIVPEIMGKKGQNGGFRDFFENDSNDFVHYLREKRQYNIRHVCKVSSPGKLQFLKYGIKGGKKCWFSDISRKIMDKFGSFS